MNKSSNVKRIHVKEENAKKAPAIDLKVQSVDLQEVVRMGLRDFMMEVGMMAVRQTMEAEVEKLAGLRYVRDPENDKSRWGTQQGLVYVNGQKVNIQRPRVVKKSAGRHTEVELETYRAFSNPDAMNEAVMAKVVAGVSTRDYEKTLEHVLDGHGVSRSAVSRRAVKESGKLLEEFYTRQFTDREFAVIMIDGIGIADVDNIVALGIDIWGKKQVLGVRQGATENTQVCLELIEVSAVNYFCGGSFLIVQQHQYQKAFEQR